VKYLGEEGDNTPLAAGAAICCPWDLLVRFDILGKIFCFRIG
jgi:predicted alpha/beta-fold hydrolase